MDIRTDVEEEVERRSTFLVVSVSIRGGVKSREVRDMRMRDRQDKQ